MLGLKEQHLSPDLHDGRRLDGHRDGEQRQLSLCTRAVVPQHTLTVEVLQSAQELQSLVQKSQ